MLLYQWTRSRVLSRFSTCDYAYFRAADELGLLPDPILETAKVRATVTAMMGDGKRPVSLLDFLPRVMVPEPSPDDDVRRARAHAEAYARAHPEKRR
jgi:hypothetical protein